MSAIAKLTDRFERDRVRTVGIIDMQWGDTGKGKLVDLLMEWAHLNVRPHGGANAGHTIVIGDKRYIFHLIPSGILWDGDGKLNVIGRGVAVDPRILAEEMSQLERSGQTYNGLRVSCSAHLVLPLDIALDKLKEARRGANVIGTTGKGMGPVFESHVGRIGLNVNDLQNKDEFARKLRRNWEARAALFCQFDPNLVRQVFQSDALEGGIFYTGSHDRFDLDAIVERYLSHAEKFREMIVDTDTLIQEAVGRKRILLEGAQGVLLSVDYGTYPYVTSSDPSLAGLAAGAGLSPEQVDYVLGVVKAPYMTRVGKGPFPTELGGRQSSEWCEACNSTDDPKGFENRFERSVQQKASINSPDLYDQGVAIRQIGDEYGATTGRLRRTGSLDLPLLRYASRYARKAGKPCTVALTKVDVLNTCKTIKLCVQYRYEGEDYRVGRTLLTRGTLLDTAIMDTHVLEHCVPVNWEYPGWCSDLKNIRYPEEVPPELQKIIKVIEEKGGVEVDVLSIGADREDTLVL